MGFLTDVGWKSEVNIFFDESGFFDFGGFVLFDAFNDLLYQFFGYAGARGEEYGFHAFEPLGFDFFGGTDEVGGFAVAARDFGEAGGVGAFGVAYNKDEIGAGADLAYGGLSI
jgi:hypothetical protein